MMNQEDLKSIKPLVSILMLFSTLLVIVFLQMEERRQGYMLIKTNKEYKREIEEKRRKSVQYAKSIRPQQLQKVAEDGTLKKVEIKQIIQMNGNETTQVIDSRGYN